MDWRTIMHANGLLTIFEECFHFYYSWKIFQKTIFMHGYSPFSNPCGQAIKSMKYRGQICPILLGRKGPFHMDGRTTMHANGFQTIFQEYYVYQHSWKIVRNLFACMDVLQSMWKGPNNCWNFMEFGSESATCTLFSLNSNMLVTVLLLRKSLKNKCSRFLS